MHWIYKNVIVLFVKLVLLFSEQFLDPLKIKNNPKVKFIRERKNKRLRKMQTRERGWLNLGNKYVISKKQKERIKEITRN